MTANTPTSTVLPSSDLDPFSHDVLEDPLLMQETLREAGPMVYLTRYDVYAFARYEQVHAALVDWQDFESGAGVGLSNFRVEKPWRPPSKLLEADPPLHDAPRRVLTRILSPRALRRLRERWAADAEELVDNLLSSTTEFDAIPTLTSRFPLRVFPDAVGMPHQGREVLLPYGDHAFNAFGPNNDLVAKGLPRVDEFAQWVEANSRRSALAPTGFGPEIWAASDRGEVTQEQAHVMMRSLLAAGVDTTVHGLSAILYAFATNPDQWRRLRQQPALARVAFDEAVRWESPVQTFFRTATTDVPVGDHVVPKGKKILMFLGAANRDPRRWANPDTFDLTRDPSGHVGFGMGIHQCAGQHVARLESEALLTALVRRISSIELAGPARRHHNNTLRAWESLPIRVSLDRLSPH